LFFPLASSRQSPLNPARTHRRKTYKILGNTGLDFWAPPVYTYKKMRPVRVLTIGSLILGLFFAQLASPAACQMALGFPATHCAMPCCKTHTPVPLKCPQVRSTTRPDAISPSTRALSSGLELAVTWGSALLSNPIFKVSYLKSAAQSFTTLLLGIRPYGRAPPAESILFSA